MEGTSKPQGRNDSELRQVYPISDVVSLETVVNLLIRKGVVRPEELFEEEQNRRQILAEANQSPPVQIDNDNDNGSQTGRKGNWLKRKMSKRRWSRRLGTFLFGWKWKKVKINKEANNFVNIQNEEE